MRSEMPFRAVGLNGSGTTAWLPARADGKAMGEPPGRGTGFAAGAGAGAGAGALFASAGWAQPTSVALLAASATRASRRVKIFESLLIEPPFLIQRRRA